MSAIFLARLSESLETGTFIKTTLGAYQGSEQELKKILIRLVEIKGRRMLSFVSRYSRSDVTKNHSLAEGLQCIAIALESDFHAAHLFSKTGDLQWRRDRKGHEHLKTLPPGLTAHPSQSLAEHDRQKTTVLSDSAAPWLKALGLTTGDGLVKAGMADKMKQTARFTEILSHTVRFPAGADRFRAADMGCGKGYLTFAMYDYLRPLVRGELDVTGVEIRPALVQLCNAAALQSGLSGLHFEEGDIQSAAQEPLDLLVALHACDTATDDALCHGLRSGARWIVLAPCCHKEIRPRIESPEILRDVLRHGIFMERSAEMLTDSLRALILESRGYRVKVFEFISLEHTGRNIMIAAEKVSSLPDPIAMERYLALKNSFGIGETYLETRMAAL